MSDQPKATFPSPTVVPAPVKTTPVPTPAKPVPVTPAVTFKTASEAFSVGVPKGLTLCDTNNFASSWFHCCLYGETDARKSVTAARFGTPENTRIVLTRRPEQLRPLQGEGYKFSLVENATALEYALLYPEKLWPDWAKLPDKVLVLDDATEAAAQLVQRHRFIEVKGGGEREVKDTRKMYGPAILDLRDIIQPLLRKQMHFIAIALARVRDNPVTGEERIGPDLSPAMLNLLLTEMEYTFYVDKRIFQLVTKQSTLTYEAPDKETGKEQTFIREIFAKNKLPVSLVKRVPPVLSLNEPLDLRAVWNKIQAAVKAGPSAVPVPSPVATPASVINRQQQEAKGEKGVLG